MKSTARNNQQKHMNRLSTWALFSALMITSTLATAQAPGDGAVVPPMVNFSGTLTDVHNKPLTDLVGVSFSLYKESQGGAPLWVETQNVQPDKGGHYKAMLGSATSQGLPSCPVCLGGSSLARRTCSRTRGPATRSAAERAVCVEGLGRRNPRRQTCLRIPHWCLFQFQPLQSRHHYRIGQKGFHPHVVECQQAGKLEVVPERFWGDWDWHHHSWIHARCERRCQFFRNPRCRSRRY